ncbi:MAG: methionine adenosyltransferase [Candidatus Omnitrophota bacterium]|nr:MAG: methionine adenosyltransferase [Candidatus Omnitrophota bacterium]
MAEKYLLSSESVACGHPDKLCDQISDAVLDAILKNDSFARVACETFVTTGLVIVGGEITTKTYVDIQQLVKKVVKNIGYINPVYGFSYNTCAIVNAINRQSSDIAMGVDRGGAGDQGMMTGYACKETAELMPLPIMLAHKLVQRMKALREDNTLNYLGPDGKAQVTLLYEQGRPKMVTSVVLACQHNESILDSSGANITEQAKNQIIDLIAKPVLEQWMDKETKFYVNATGKFVIAGPQSDTGMTGRKIIVDTYGGVVPVGGGAFSGKDPTKVDRSAAYMARYIAKNVVASGVAEKCYLQLAYCIGVEDPVSVFVDTYGTGEISDSKISELVRKVFPLTPKGIIKELDLLKPIYLKTACHGHFGRETEGFTWEKTDKANILKKNV